MDQSAAINMQLLGGIWILQTFPAIVAGLYTRWFHRWALFAGWAAGILYGTVAAYNVVNPVTNAHFGGSIAADPRHRRAGLHRHHGVCDQRDRCRRPVTVVFRAMKVPDGKDITRSSDYGADENDPKVAQIQREYPLGESGTATF